MDIHSLPFFGHFRFLGKRPTSWHQLIADSRVPKSLRRFQKPFKAVEMADAKEGTEAVTASVECAEVDGMEEAILKLFVHFVHVVQFCLFNAISKNVQPTGNATLITTSNTVMCSL